MTARQCVDRAAAFRHWSRLPMIGLPGQVAEWLKAADCKSARVSVRWFESSPVHHPLFAVQPRRCARTALLAARAMALPMRVPIAAEHASPNTAANHKPISEGAGGRRNTRTAAKVEARHGQIRRGRGRLVLARTTRVASATSALNGRTMMAEKSTPDN